MFANRRNYTQTQKSALRRHALGAGPISSEPAVLARRRRLPQSWPRLRRLGSRPQRRPGSEDLQRLACNFGCCQERLGRRTVSRLDRHPLDHASYVS
jgi:hypothetical protein